MTNRHSFLYCLFAAAVFFGFSPPSRTGAEEIFYSAIIMDTRGDVSLTRKGQARAAGLGELLYPGDAVDVAKGASLTINYLQSGWQEQWPEGTKVFVGAARSEHIPSGVLLVNKKVVLPRIESPQKGSFTLRGAGGVKIVATGLSNTAILEQQPVFRWLPLDSADSYTVTLYLETEGKALWRRAAAGGELTFPQSEAPLAFGGRYKWEAAAFQNKKVIAKKSSYFYLPEQEDAAYMRSSIARFQDELARNAQETSARLAFIFFLEHCCLYDAALAQYEILRAARGESGAMRQRRETLLQIRQADRHY